LGDPRLDVFKDPATLALTISTARHQPSIVGLLAVRYSILRRILLTGFGVIALLVAGGSFGGLYVYLHGPSFLGLVSAYVLYRLMTALRFPEDAYFGFCCVSFAFHFLDPF